MPFANESPHDSGAGQNQRKGQRNQKPRSSQGTSGSRSLSPRQARHRTYTVYILTSESFRSLSCRYGRVVDGSGLENRRGEVPLRVFESHYRRQIVAWNQIMSIHGVTAPHYDFYPLKGACLHYHAAGFLPDWLNRQSIGFVIRRLPVRLRHQAPWHASGPASRLIGLQRSDLPGEEQAVLHSA